jgi:hypothetical protein
MVPKKKIPPKEVQYRGFQIIYKHHGKHCKWIIPDTPDIGVFERLTDAKEAVDYYINHRGNKT